MALLPNRSDRPTVDIEKTISAQHDDGLKPDLAQAGGDYSGAVAKSDPAEIRLVRKLDFWIMVRQRVLPHKNV
jgi:hypothetical protein